MPTSRCPRRASRGRQHIIECAGAVIARRGYEDTRFSDVAEASGTSISTLQYLFGNRDDLLIAALRYRAEEFLAEVREVGDAVDDPADRLRAVVAAMMSIDYSLDRARADWAVWVEYWRAASRDEELRVEAVQTYQAWRALLEDAITSVGAPAGIDGTALATSATAMVDGYGIQIVLRDDFDRAAAASTVMQWLESALKSRAV